LATLAIASMLAALLTLVPSSPASAASGKVSSQGTLGNGYFFVATDGGIFNFGDSEFKGSTGNISLNKPIVGAAATPSGEGYYLVASDGGIFTFGDATFLGSEGGGPLNSPIVAMAVTATGKGYWLFAADGGVFTHGDAGFFGSEGAIKLNKPIVGADVTPGGTGYYLVASDGGIFTHGKTETDAPFYGSEGGTPLNKPIVGMAVTDDSSGYYLVASDGGIFTHGKTPQSAPFFGSEGGTPLNKPIVGMALSVSNQGYYLVASDGGIFTHGDAQFLGSTGAITLNKPVVGMAVTPNSPLTNPAAFQVNLRGSAEVGGGDPDAKASVAAVDISNDETPEACINVRVDNIDTPTGLHIHRGVAGVNGPIVIDFTNLDKDNSAVKCVTITKELADEVLGNPQGFYLNVHTTAFPTGAARGQLKGHTAVGVTNTDATTGMANVVLLDTERPTAAGVLRTVDVKGAPVVGVDVRPGTLDAYLLLISKADGTEVTLVKVDLAGNATTIASAIPVTAASAYGFDFNPVVDRIRVISNAGENFRLNPDTGEKTSDTAIPAGFAGAAYTNNVKGSATTTLYDINYGNDSLFLQGGIDGTPSPNSGAVTPVGALGVDLSSGFGFDIAPKSGTALVAGQVTGSTNSVLLAVNLATGAATNLGRIDSDATNGIQAFAIFA
jgi:hypothetical protein